MCVHPISNQSTPVYILSGIWSRLYMQFHHGRTPNHLRLHSCTCIQRSQRISRLSHQYPRYTCCPSHSYPKRKSRTPFSTVVDHDIQSFVFVLAVGYVLITQVTDAPLGRPSVRRYMVIAGLGVVVSVMTGYYSMFYLTLSQYITLRCMDPFAIALLCRIFLHERVTRTQICCCCEYCVVSRTGPDA
jgi:uncharacterized membrane protein